MSALLLVAAASACHAQRPAAYAGFDRNDYPGDAALPALRQSFRFTGYWLTNPPGEKANSWAGKRAVIKQNGFGFLVLSRGRTDAELKGKDAAALGREDAKVSVAAAAREGFPHNVLIFLDQEEGGRLLPEQAAYLFAWVDGVRAAGARAGVYCSAIPVSDGPGKTISTAQDIVERMTAQASNSSRSKSPGGRLAIWVANDACPPSPGCAMGQQPIWAEVFALLRCLRGRVADAQSPRRPQFSAGCPQNQAPDGKCYAPGIAHSPNTFVDLDTAQSPDPSEER